MCARIQSLALASAAALALCCAASLADAQQPAPAAAPAPATRDTPRPEDLEPAVDTTHAAPAAGPQNPGTPPASDAAGTRPTQAAPSAASASTPAAAQGTSPKAGARKGPDRLQLDTTEITGNRELPKVLYIVPWKRSDLGDLAGRPVNSLLDEVLQPLDRDVFTRENRYYDALKPDQAGPKADPVQGSRDKP
jgi:hypothetical protein